MRREKNERCQEWLLGFCISNWKDGLSLTEMGKTKDRVDMGRKQEKFTFGGITFKMSISHLRGNASRAFNIQVWSSMERSKLELQLRVIDREITFKAMRLEDISTGMSINKGMKSPSTKPSRIPTD